MHRLLNRAARYQRSAMNTHDLEWATGANCQNYLLHSPEHGILSLFPAIRVPHPPATGDEIGEYPRFANQCLRRETKGGPLQPRAT